MVSVPIGLKGGQCPYWTEGSAGWTRQQIGRYGQCPYWTEGWSVSLLD